MNSLVLLAVAAVIFGLGYRYFARFLASAAFGSRPDDYNIGATGRTEGGADPATDYAPLIARAGLPFALAGVGSIAAWGWTPGFLWIVISGALLAGSYALVLNGPARSSVPPVPISVVYGLGLLTNAFSVLLLARLLAALPVAAAAYLFELILLWGLTAIREQLPRPTAGILAAITVVVACALGAEYPIAVTGNLAIYTGMGAAKIGPTVMWTILILADLRFKKAVRTDPLERFAGQQLAALALLALLAVVFWHPTIALPPFRATQAGTHALPTLVLAFSGLPLAPVYFFWAYRSNPATQPLHRTDSYALAVGLALFSLMAFLAVTTMGLMVPSVPLGTTLPGPLAGLQQTVIALSRWLSVRTQPSEFMLALVGVSVAMALRTALGFGLDQQARVGETLWPDTARFGARSALLPLVVAAIAIDAAPRESWELLEAAGLIFAGLILWQANDDHKTAIPLLGATVIILADWALLARTVTYWHERQGIGVAVALLILGWQGVRLWHGRRA